MSLSRRLQAELEPELKRANWEFKKLTKDEIPYYFVHYDLDDNFQLCLYYGIEARRVDGRDNVKRVPLSELANAITVCAQTGRFDRVIFEDCCSVARSAGQCGFAVVGRCMELLGVAEYVGEEHQFRLVSAMRAKGLLQEEP